MLLNRFIGLVCSVILLFLSNGENVESSETRNKTWHLVEETPSLIDLNSTNPNKQLFDENDVSSEENEDFLLLKKWDLIPKLGLARGRRIKKVLRDLDDSSTDEQNEVSKVVPRRKRFLSPNILLGKKFLGRHHNFAIERSLPDTTAMKLVSETYIFPTNINEIGYEDLRKFHRLVSSTIFSLCPRLDYFDTMRDRMNEIVEEKLKAAAQSRLIPLSSSKRDFAILNKRIKKCGASIVPQPTTERPKIIEPENRTTNRYEYYRKLAQMNEKDERERNARSRQFDVVPSPLNILRFEVMAGQLVVRKCANKGTFGNDAFTDFLSIFADIMKSTRLSGIKTMGVTIHQTEMLDMIEMVKQCKLDFQMNQSKVSYKLIPITTCIT